MVIEIVTFASSFFAVFTSLLFSSCIDEKQLKEEQSETNLDMTAAPDEEMISQNKNVSI